MATRLLRRADLTSQVAYAYHPVGHLGSLPACLLAHALSHEKEFAESRHVLKSADLTSVCLNRLKTRFTESLNARLEGTSGRHIAHLIFLRFYSLKSADFSRVCLNSP